MKVPKALKFLVLSTSWCAALLTAVITGQMWAKAPTNKVVDPLLYNAINLFFAGVTIFFMVVWIWVCDNVEVND